MELQQETIQFLSEKPAMSESIVCPNCSYPIEVSTALTAQVRESMRKELDAEVRRKEMALAGQEDALKDRERGIEQARRAIEDEVSLRVTQERELLQKEAKSQAQEGLAVEMNDLRTQLEEARREIALSQQAELHLRKDRRELEVQKQTLELTVARTIDEERTKIREEAKNQADEEHRLKSADHEKLVTDLRRQIGDLKRKAEQGSLQIQGEVMELELEDLLRGHFPLDTIEPIPTSNNGGDVYQHVQDHGGIQCGTILWEAKRTKSFNEAWLPKLRDDVRASRSHLAVLVSTELPKGVSTFTCIDGVWVTSRACLLGLASALRLGLVEVARTRRNLEGKQTKVELLYDYLGGPEFRQRVEGIVEAFVTLREDLESEKRSMRRIWNKREKQLDRAVANTTALYGDLGGILGPKLPQLPQLELSTIAARSDSFPAELLTSADESPF
jgi:hypothetical protein